MKSAEQTPLSALVFAQFIKEAGFPPGVFNLISGFGKTAGAAISAHMDIDKVAFTGSTLVGRQIMKAAASSNLKKVTLELGGKSPNIVFNDADIEKAISWVNFGIYYNHGQCCCAGSRIYVQSGIYDKFVEAFKKRATENKVGDPFDESTFQGPQVSQLQYDRIMGYIEEGKKEGATLETGGGRHGDKGYFIQPTIFSNVAQVSFHHVDPDPSRFPANLTLFSKQDAKIMQEEIFGPVCAIAKFETEEEVLKLGNDTMYGLAAAVHTQDLNTAIRVSNALHAGTVWVNCYKYVPLLHSFPKTSLLTDFSLASFTMLCPSAGTRPAVSAVSWARLLWQTTRRTRVSPSGWEAPCSKLQG
jgi:aldehyde dehydrogenase (NAD+)